MGRPNVGKSTLVNAFLGQKVAAVSPRPQTTRKRQMGILNLVRGDLNAQIIFVDTPGVHQPRHKLGEAMNKEAVKTLEECELILFVADASQSPQPEDQILIAMIKKIRRIKPVVLALNKVDLLKENQLAGRTQEFLVLAPSAKP